MSTKLELERLAHEVLLSGDAGTTTHNEHMSIVMRQMFSNAMPKQLLGCDMRWVDLRTVERAVKGALNGNQRASRNFDEKLEFLWINLSATG